MRRKTIKKLSLFLLLLTVPVGADFTLYWRDQNYFLFEGRGYTVLDLDSAGGIPNDTLYSTIKLNMKPSLSITDRLAIHSSFEAFARPNTTTSQEEGAVLGQQSTDTNQYGPGLPNLPRLLFGSTSGYGRSGVTTGDSNFIVKTIFLEYMGDWGIFRMGRQPRQWGLGIRYNSGENPTDKFSDRTDTLSYELGLGNFKVSALYSKILENNIRANHDDVDAYEGYVTWNDPENDLDSGFMFTYLYSLANFLKLQTADGFLKKKWKDLKGGFEAVTSFGRPGTISGNDAFQVGLASELSYQIHPSLEAFTKAGYASGADLDSAGKLTLFAFNRNYDIALLMFNQGLGAIGASNGASVAKNITGIDALNDPDVNAIFSALYINMGANYSYNDRLGAGLSTAYAVSPKHLVAGGDRDWGKEVDLKGWYQFSENIKLKVDGGVFFPGKLYSGSPTFSPRATTDKAYGGVLNAIVTF